MFKTILTVVQVLSCLLLIVTVLLQSGKRSGLSGAISGGSESFISRNKAKTLDARIAKATTWVAIGFILLTLLLNLV